MDKKIILQDFSPLGHCKVGSAAGGNEGRCRADTNRISWDEEGQKEMWVQHLE